MKMLFRLLLWLTLGATAWAQEPSLRARASEEYRAGRFREAAELYQNALRAGETSAPLFYNLGNAWYRAGEPGRAILNYERALALDPSHPEAAANLQLARDQAHALQLQGNRWDELVARLQPNHYAIAAAIAFWTAAFALAALALSRRRAALRTVLLVLGLLVCAGSVAALYRLETGQRGRDLAIVTDRKIEARLATADNSGTVLALPTGSEIQILSTRGEWTYAALPNNLRGWIPAQSAERVRL